MDVLIHRPGGTRDALAPFHVFSEAEWSRLRADQPMTLSEEEIFALQGFNDRIDPAQVETIYLPLARLLRLYFEATDRLHAATQQFLGKTDGRVPFIIGMAGSVAVGKTTTARILKALMERWPGQPKVDLVPTDGFLLPNAVLLEHGLMERKGFPESYD
jgi:type I pantothenate kinase